MASAAIPSTSFLAKYGIKAPVATLQNGQGSGSGSGQMSVPQFEIPDWLTTNPDDLLGEIMSEYSGTGKRFDPTGISNAYKNQINTVQGMGGQIADNAVREGLARSGQEGGSVNTAMLKAQAMLPVYDQVGGLKKDRALAVADVRAREAGMRASLAQAIGGMRTQYLNMLADTYMRGRGMNASWQNQMFQQNMQQQQFDWQKDLATEQMSQAQQAKAFQPFQGQISRAPNNSGMGGTEFTPEYKQWMEEMGIDSPGAPPRYSTAAGVLGGPAVDAYNDQWRGILSTATGRPAWSFGGMDSANAALFNQGGGGYATDDAGQYDPVTGRYNNKPVYRTA